MAGSPSSAAGYTPPRDTPPSSGTQGNSRPISSASHTLPTTGFDLEGMTGVAGALVLAGSGALLAVRLLARRRRKQKPGSRG